MFLGLIAAVALGVFCTTIALWLGRFASAPAGIDAHARMARFRDGLAVAPVTSAATAPAGVALRRRARSINFGGQQLVSSKVAQRWAIDLERAGLTLNVREFLMLRLGLGIALGAIATILLPSLPLFVFPIGAIVGFIAPGFWLSMRKKRRRRKLEGQLVELLSMMSGGLRAGFGLLQSFEATVDQLPDPLAGEVRRMMRDTAVGSSVERALQTMNERIGSSDLDIAVTAILIQRSVGGNLAEILETVAHTIRERDRIRGEISALTAQGRLTGLVIGGIPFALFGLFLVMSPEYVTLLFTDSLGRMMLAGGLTMWVIGFALIQKIVNIEI